jgi:hypothetical protein
MANHPEKKNNCKSLYDNDAIYVVAAYCMTMNLIKF